VMVVAPDSEFFRYFKSPAPTRRWCFSPSHLS